MRNCAECGVLDRAEIDLSVNCTCDALSDDMHKPDCHRLRHSVRAFMRLIGRSGERGSNVLTEQKWTEGRWEQRGWRAVVRDGKLFASKLLCSACIVRFFEKLENRADYERKSAAIAPGSPDVQQSFWRSMCSP